MSIKTDVEEVEKNTIVLKVEVPFEEIGESINQTYREIATKSKIPGFRKGKAPRAVIDQMFGKENILKEALNQLIPLFYPEAVKSSGIEPVTMPEIDVIKISENEPFVFKAKVQVKPKVKLGSLEMLVLEPLPKKPLAEKVKTELERLRNKFATLQLVKRRGARKDDFVLIDYTGYLQGKPFEGGQASDYMLELGSGTFIPGFEEQLIGEKVGSEKEVKATFPEDYRVEHLAGQEVLFNVEVKEIKTKKKPKADDEFAKNVSKFDTLKELKDDLKKSVKKRLEAEEKSALRTSAIEKMTELSEVDLPTGMVEWRVDQMVEDFGRQIKKMQQMDLKTWLESSGVSPEMLRQNYMEEAKKSLRTELILEALMKAENIEATDEDIENEIKKLAKGAKKEVDELKEEINKRQGHDFLKQRLSLDKTIDFLAKKVKIKEKEKDDLDESGADSN